MNKDPDFNTILAAALAKQNHRMTNGDRIRAMTDEELTEFLCDIRSNGSYYGCENCPAYDFCENGHTGFFDWLRQEADDE